LKIKYFLVDISCLHFITGILDCASKIYSYWMACWREGGRTRNVHLGSAGKMDAEAARQKARERKAEALGS